MKSSCRLLDWRCPVINKFRSIGVILFSFILGGCNFLPDPVSLIEAPKHAQRTEYIEDNLLQTVKGLLPAGTSLYVPDEPVGCEAYYLEDINNDGRNELIVFYKSTVRADQAGALVFQMEKGVWKTAADLKGTGFEIAWGSTADITGDDVPELLLGSNMGVSSGNILEIFSWNEDGFQKISELLYHKLDVIYSQDFYRLAIWNRELSDVFKIDVLKWEQGQFVTDFESYHSYFSKAAAYYEKRTKEVPDASYYWYYLADARLKAGNPYSALAALNQGLSMKITVPAYEEFLQLQEKIKITAAEQQENDFQYYDSHGDLTMNLPRELISGISMKTEEGENFEYIIHVYWENLGIKHLLFDIEVHAKDFVFMDEFPLDVVEETDGLIYGVRRGEEKLIDESVLEEMISSIRLGAPYAKHDDFGEELLIKKVNDAYKRFVYVGMGGKMETEVIESFPVNEMDYRYLGIDLDSFAKLTDYLSSAFTEGAIQAMIDSTGIIEHQGRLAQPNADGGSLLNYERASILQMRDLGSEKQFDLKVPVGSSLSYEIVQVVLKKTESGWRISSNPVTM